jgi:hypothetical protein
MRSMPHHKQKILLRMSTCRHVAVSPIPDTEYRRSSDASAVVDILASGDFKYPVVWISLMRSGHEGASVE